MNYNDIETEIINNIMHDLQESEKTQLIKALSELTINEFTFYYNLYSDMLRVLHKGNKETAYILFNELRKELENLRRIIKILK